MPIPALLHQLLQAPGPSGHESGPARVWREAVQAFSAEVSSDVSGSSVVRVPGTGSGPRLALVGHIDEIGLHVTHISDDGFLRFDKVGGWDPAQLIGQRVRILRRDRDDLIGVIGRKPVHLLRGDEAEKTPRLGDLRIDIGARDGEDARTHVDLGDVAVIDGDPVEMLGDRIVARALDNRIGAYVIAEAARLIAEAGGAKGDVYAVASAQEEIGSTGAITSIYGLAPDLIVVVDTTPATDQPGITLIDDLTDHELGGGPVIAHGITLHPLLTDRLIAAGEAAAIPVTVESLGALTGSDADHVLSSQAGIATALLSVTIRYMHSPVEMASLTDIENAAGLIAAFALALPAELDLRR